MKKFLTGLLALSLTFFAGCQSSPSSSSEADTTTALTTQTEATTEPQPETSTPEVTTAEPEPETATPETTLFHVVNHGELFDDFFLRYADGIGKVEYEEVLSSITDGSLNPNFKCDHSYIEKFDSSIPESGRIEITDDYGDVLYLAFAEDSTGACTLFMDSYTRTEMGREVSISDSYHYEVKPKYWKIETDSNSQTEASSVQELGDWVFQLDIAP